MPRLLSGLRLAAAAGLCLLVLQPASAEIAPTVYTLGAGDRVKVTVFGEGDLSGEFEVSSRGAIAFPLVGEVRVAGLSLRDLERAITAKLKDGYLKKPRVNAEVVNYRPLYILGEVKSPGSYPYVSGMTVINAIALGGGFTYRAKKRGIRITRSDDAERQEESVSHNEIVLPGDVIRVPERFF